MINISGVGFVTVVALVAGMASVSEGKVLCPDGEGKSPPAHAWVNDDILVKGLVIDGVLERGHCDLKGVTVLGDIKVGPGGVLTLQRHNNQQDSIKHISDIGGAGGEEDHHSTVTGDIKGKGADKIQLSHGTIVYGNFEAITREKAGFDRCTKIELAPSPHFSPHG